MNNPYIDEHLDIIRKRAEIEINKFMASQSSETAITKSGTTLMNIERALSIYAPQQNSNNVSLTNTLCLAASEGRSDIVQKLFESGLCKPNNFTTITQHGVTESIFPLQLAAHNNHCDTAKILLDFGAKPYLTLSAQSYHFQSPLIMATTPEMTDLLLQYSDLGNPSLCQKEKENSADEKGRALLRAIDTGLLEKAAYLIQQNANVNFEEPGNSDTCNVWGRKNTPLSTCIQRIHNIERYGSEKQDKIPAYVCIALMLLEAGANANQVQEHIGTPLIAVSQLRLNGLGTQYAKPNVNATNLLPNNVNMHQLATQMSGMLAPNQPRHMLTRPTVTANNHVTAQSYQRRDLKTALVESLIQHGANVFFVWQGKSVLDYYEGQPQAALIKKQQLKKPLKACINSVLNKAKEFVHTNGS